MDTCSPFGEMEFVEGFVGLCDVGWRMGWHERNGGNLSYRLTEEEAEGVRLGSDAEGSPWEPLGVAAPSLAGSLLLVTGSGRYLKNASAAPERELGIVELSPEGDAWRLVWGFAEGGRPTSELPSHVLNLSVRSEATGGACRVLYHAHPSHLVAMTALVPLTDRDVTLRLWRAMTECVIACPRGLGVVPWAVPGSAELAEASSELFRTYDAVVWAQHGLFASGDGFDEALGLVHAVEKAAEIYCLARSMNAGSEDFPNTIDDDGLRAIAHRYDLPLNEALLD